MKNRIEELNKLFRHKNVTEIFEILTSEFKNVTFSTSFGIEDQLITWHIAQKDSPINIFTLDTGRLFEETYEVFHRTSEKYDLKIDVFTPNAEKLESLVSNKGPYSFYDSVDNRKECCSIRKIEPLKRALIGKDIWITGLRKEQSPNRSDMNMVEWDAVNGIVKVHPIFYMSEETLINEIEIKNIPTNALHKKGFPSIGCSPCTRAITEGEDVRAGRWWWESSKKECGLHQINKQ